MKVRTQIKGYEASPENGGLANTQHSRCTTCGRPAGGAAAVEVTRAVVQSFARRLLDHSENQPEALLTRAMTAAARAAGFIDRGVTLTTAVRSAVKRTFPELPQDEWLGELEDEMLRRPLTVRLLWEETPLDIAQVLRDPKWARVGGVYIKMDDEKPSKLGKTMDNEKQSKLGKTMGDKKPSTLSKRPSKVGKTMDFQVRAGQYRRHSPNSTFYLARINSLSETDPAGILEAVEHAVARTLLRMGEPLPEHDRPRDTVTTVLGRKIEIQNVLPAHFPLHSRGPAYHNQWTLGFTNPKTGKLRPPVIGTNEPLPANLQHLVIAPTADKLVKWEA